MEQFAESTAIVSLPRTGKLGADLEALFATWAGRQPKLTFKRTVEAATPETSALTNLTHVVRLWAAEEVRLLAHNRRRHEAVELAAQQQLVTPVSGAVVLETKQQFDAAGLTPVDPTSVPTVPEPSTLTLLIAGTIAFAVIGRKRRARIS